MPFKPSVVKDPITERQSSACAAELIGIGGIMHLDELQHCDVVFALLVEMSHHHKCNRWPRIFHFDTAIPLFEDLRT